MLRASLARRGMDWWAVALAAFGSLGSIALNVAGVGYGADPMEYIVAAVPPSAALVAFGALMRQLHERLAHDAEDAPASPAVPSVPEVATDFLEGSKSDGEVTLERLDEQDAVGTPELPPGTGQDAEDDWAEANQIPPQPPLLNSAQVAAKYGIEMSTVRTWVSVGRLTVHSKDARNRSFFHPDALPELEAVSS